MQKKSEPRNRNEQEITGYRDVLSTIHESYDYISPTSNIIQQLHRDLYSYNQNGFGGKYKSSDNIIAETDGNGIQKVRFAPVPAFETEEAMRIMTERFLEEWNSGKTDKLLLIPMFILDFLCIHPFNDGNGRMSRLLTLLLLYRSNYIVGKYISIEMLIEKSKETYYEALKQSSADWHTGENNYLPFISYYLGIFVKAYQEFQDRVEHLHGKTLSKAERIRAVFSKRIGKITKSDIATLCPDISLTTIERTLKEMLDNGEIQKIGSGRGTGYLINS